MFIDSKLFICLCVLGQAASLHTIGWWLDYLHACTVFNYLYYFIWDYRRPFCTPIFLRKNETFYYHCTNKFINLQSNTLSEDNMLCKGSKTLSIFKLQPNYDYLDVPFSAQDPRSRVIRNSKNGPNYIASYLRSFSLAKNTNQA